MKITNFVKRLATSLAGIILVAPALVSVPLAHATGSSTQGAPSQSSCDSGSTTYTWDELDNRDSENIQAVDRPVVTSMFVGEQEITNYETPAVGQLGVSICPNVNLGRRSSMFVYQRVAPPEDQPEAIIQDFNLTGADIDPDNDVETDNNILIDEDSEITLNLADMGDLAQYYSFSLVHGYVTNWETEDLGTPDASLSVTLKPVRTPFGSGDDFGFCTATPPNCSAIKSDADGLSASLDMTFTTINESHPDEDWSVDGAGSDMRGAYFGMTGAMGGWAEAKSDGQSTYLKASLGGPHYLSTVDLEDPQPEDLNVGSLQAYLPDSVLENLFGAPADELDLESLVVNRTEGDEDTDAEDVAFDIDTLETGGIVVSMEDVTFSSPRYNIGLAGFHIGGGEGESGGGQEDTDTSHSIETEDGTQANLQTGEDTVINSFTSVKESGLAIGDSAFNYPFGLFNFNISVPQGSTQSIDLLFMTDLKPYQVTARKYNSTSHAYTTISGATFGEDQIDGHHILTLSYEITDGGTLDQDGAVNGVIVDPVGVGQVVVSAPNTGFGGQF